jgi:hypothetical protein
MKYRCIHAHVMPSDHWGPDGREKCVTLDFIRPGPPAPVLDLTPRWIEFGVLSYADFAAGAASNTIPLFNLAPHAIIHGIKIKHTASFTGGSITAYTISVGDINTVDLFASAYDVYQAPASTVYQLSSNFYAEDNTNQTQIYATATSTGDNLSSATAGAVNFYALLAKS